MPNEINDPYYNTQGRPEDSRKRNYAGFFLVGGATGALITFLLMKDCNGNSYVSKNGDAGVDGQDVSMVDAGTDYDSRKNDASTSDAGVAYDADIPKCNDIRGCYDQKYVDQLEAELKTGNSSLESCNHNLESCLTENDKLSKRPKSCPTYQPNVCAPTPKCSEMPYIRRGE